MSAAAPALLALQQASVRFGHVQALQGVSLDLHRGERLALVGANGSGKSTLLRLLHGLLPSAARRVHAVDGREPVIAMLFQRPFMLDLSVRRNVLLSLWLRGVPRDQRAERCDRALQRVGLLPQARQAARTLSGGQQQRLAFARAWALAPDILLLDEPTASLDPSAKREVESLIEAFAAAGMTVLLCTHNLGQAKRLAQRVLYLEAGQLRADLPTPAFFDPAATHGAQAFLRGELPWGP